MVSRAAATLIFDIEILQLGILLGLVGQVRGDIDIPVMVPADGFR